MRSSRSLYIRSAVLKTDFKLTLRQKVDSERRPMRILLVLASIIMVAMAPAQTLNSDPDLLVVKFNSGKQETGGHMIRSVGEPDPPMNEPIRLDLPKKDELQEIKNRRDMQERSSEMRTKEINDA